jgi:hypothetical protein
LPKELLLPRIQQVVAPGDGLAHRPQAFRGPPLGNGSARSSLSNSAEGGRTATRAAASWMASGSPSRRRQIIAKAPALSGVRAKSGAYLPRALDDEAHRRIVRKRIGLRRRQVGRGKRRHRVPLFAVEAKRNPAGNEKAQLGDGREETPQCGSGIEDLFQVVEDDQRAPAA